ncbi:chemotaxis protein, partial [Brachyspira hampsonii]|nr:chemotaxis protein [Brachyspira hampsonii]
DNFKQNNYDTAYGTKILKSSADNKWSLAIISGVRDANNNLIGSIYMIINWEELINKLKKLKLDETGRLFALDNDGII